jgi:hypothetical protein
VALGRVELSGGVIVERCRAGAFGGGVPARLSPQPCLPSFVIGHISPAVIDHVSPADGFPPPPVASAGSSEKVVSYERGTPLSCSKAGGGYRGSAALALKRPNIVREDLDVDRCVGALSVDLVR